MSPMAMTSEEVLAAIPQQEPFRFIDEILELDEDHIVSRYRFRPESDFYRGHFPGNPVTPGVILIESMAQAGIVALGIFLVSHEEGGYDPEKMMTLFTDASVDFGGIVKPGDRVTVECKKVFWRRRKLRAEAEMKLDDGTVVCSGNVSGMGVMR
ncbi:MAG: beta-hydroxyacyl-ACP dehydratase [Deltaproteobacteria bacterium]|nr:beta-hydroxyacyl-ACP dehydratase [Deltaproteobacteria bacterium]MBW2401490.1 beta-hydroxyacyl-ACP dehydratase [Deltaproteobacteria bacterium]MBW2666434.1 beta-hydroxyacyl-ACP dehydratase [Deltaproteobacteria bacterium]